MVGTPLDFDDVLDLCRHEHRRIVLAVLATEDRTLSLGELTEEIVAKNHHAEMADVSAETVSRIETALYHAHLPQLASAGLVEYDAESKRVERTDAFDRVQPHLSSILGVDPVLETPTA